MEKSCGAEYTTTYYDKDGAVTEGKFCVAKIVQFNSYAQYYVLYGHGELFDKFGANANVNDFYRFRKVSKAAFTDYLEYLTTNNGLLLTKANRSILEGA